MATNIGLNIVEVDGSAAPAIVGAATSVGAFNIITRRGVPNRPVPITSFTKFVERFGGHFTGGLGAYMVKGFFDNGGVTAYVNRVVSTDTTSGAAPAKLTLNNSATPPVATLLLEAGFRGAEDPGTWGNELHAALSATPTQSVRLHETSRATLVGGVTLATTTNMQSAPALKVLVDGQVTPTEIVFQASDFNNSALATPAEIRDAINRRTGKLKASLGVDANLNKIVIESTGEVARLGGRFTRLEVTTAHTILGFDAAQAADGIPATPAATGALLARVDHLRVGDVIKLAALTLSATVKLQSVNYQTGDVTWAPSVGSIGSFNALALRASKVEFDLTIAVGGSTEEHVVETWSGLSMEPDLPNYAPRVLNDPIQGSRYVAADDLRSENPTTIDVLAAVSSSRFDPGRDGTPTANDFIGDSANRTGFYSFDPYDVQLLGCERTDGSIVTAALAYAANRGDCMFIGSVPEGYVEAGAAVAYGQAFQAKKVYGALYGPWVGVTDPIGSGATPIKRIPAVGHVMGAYARIETTRGVWKAPAGDEANLLGVLDVEYRLSDAEHTDLVRNGSVNGIRAIPRSGIVVDASRTLSTDTRWLYVNVRLLFNYVKSSLKVGLRWVRQEPNRDTLWAAVKFNSVIPFLMGLWRQGAFGTGAPADVFSVICDANNNPPDEVDKGNLKVEVYFYPSKPAETIVIIVGQQASGAKVSEA